MGPLVLPQRRSFHHAGVQPYFARIGNCVIRFGDGDISSVRHGESDAANSFGNHSDMTLFIQRDNSSPGGFGDIESPIRTKGDAVVSGADGGEMFD